MAEKFLRERFGADACDHHIFAICSDGDLMEGVASEAASLAGHLRLGRLVYLYDDNQITIDGSTDLSFSHEDVEKRFQAYGWHTLAVEDGNDLEAIEAAIRAGIAEEDRPTLIRLRTVIGFGSPRAGTRKAHSDPMPDEEVRATKEALGWDPDAHFLVPDEVYAHWREPCLERGAALQAEWNAQFHAWAVANPGLAGEWHDAWAGKPRAGVADALPVFDPDAKGISTRVAGNKVMQAFAPYVPTMVGGAADLVHSTFTEFEGDQTFSPEHAGRNVAWGVREHGMGAAVNGLALHGGIVKPFCSTFFVFTDYMRPPIRLSALMKLDAVWIFSHDSVAVGEDGPTHQPVEHLAAMRAIPNLTVIRPADANETAEAWGAILEELPGRSASCSPARTCRRSTAARSPPPSGLRRGAYVLADVDSPDVVLVATGAEVGTALGARDLLAEKGVQVRVVSMPSWELFEAAGCRLPRRGPPAGRAEDLARGRLDVRLVALGRRLDRDRHVRRLGQGRQGARALRDQPRGRRRARPGTRRRARLAIDRPGRVHSA